MDLISPYITAYEVEADYLAGDTAAAEHLMHLTWDQMIDQQNPPERNGWSIARQNGPQDAKAQPAFTAGLRGHGVPRPRLLR